VEKVRNILAGCKKESDTRRARNNLERELSVMKEVIKYDIVGITRILEFTLRNIHNTGERIKASCLSTSSLSATLT
jgi:hypothetical protein